MSEQEKKNIQVENLIIGRSIKTKILEKISSGSYGDIHYGVFMNTGEKVAVKLEKMNAIHPQLLPEGNIMRHLEGGPGIPHIFWFGCYEPDFNCMVLDLLGPNLQELFSYCDHIFSLKTVLLVADQVFETLDYIHKHEFVHKDIKPDNFAIGAVGTSKENKIFIFDFGLSKKTNQRRHSFLSATCIAGPKVGTARYMGVHVHDGLIELPRDDMESFAYCLIYFLKGKLPWQGIKNCSNREEKLEKIKNIKKLMTAEVLCSNLPAVFCDLVQTCRNCRNLHDTSVSGSRWKKSFQQLAQEKNIIYDYHYDWVEKKNRTGLEYILASANHGHASS